MLVATKVTGSQVAEVAVTAYVLSTRSGIPKKPTSPLFKENQSHGNNASVRQFFSNNFLFYPTIFWGALCLKLREITSKSISALRYRNFRHNRAIHYIFAASTFGSTK